MMCFSILGKFYFSANSDIAPATMESAGLIGLPDLIRMETEWQKNIGWDGERLGRIGWLEDWLKWKIKGLAHQFKLFWLMKKLILRLCSCQNLFLFASSFLTPQRPLLTDNVLQYIQNAINNAGVDEMGWADEGYI